MPYSVEGRLLPLTSQDVNGHQTLPPRVPRDSGFSDSLHGALCRYVLPLSTADRMLTAPSQLRRESLVVYQGTTPALGRRTWATERLLGWDGTGPRPAVDSGAS